MEDLTGKKFGLYQIVTPLGEGGMAAVYKAYQFSVDRYVALKVLPPILPMILNSSNDLTRKPKFWPAFSTPHSTCPHVKPSNILIDKRGNCLLSDFGLAKMVEGTSNLTGSGYLVGTPDYMSPEQGKLGAS